MRNRGFAIGIVALVLLVGCMPAPLPLPAQTPLPPLATLPPAVDDAHSRCEAALQNQGDNWPRAIGLLEALHAESAECPPGERAGATLYATRLAYGHKLRADGDLAAARVQYEAALALDATRDEAVSALRDLGVVAPDPLPACSEDVLAAAFAAVPPYEPVSSGVFVRVAGAGLVHDGEPFVLRGVNYEFPGSVDLAVGQEVVALELDLIAGAGFSAVRVPLVMDKLFQCAGSGAVPRPDAIDRLDAFVAAVAARDLQLILVLNAAPDLEAYPLYDSPPHVLDRMRYLAERYAAEPALLAWDVRAGGDADYRLPDGRPGAFSREVVLTWLAETTALMRLWDPNHLVTAAWSRDEAAIAPYVDFVSLQHWESVVTLRARLADLRAVTAKPVVLAAFGFSTTLMSEAQQGQYLRETIQIGEYSGLAGWLIWTAFDRAEASEAGSFGLWRADYEARSGLGLVQILLYDPVASTDEAENK